MHELSIALSLVDAACDEASRLPGESVHVLHVDVGVLAGVVKEALCFAFEAAAAGTPVEGARLEIHDVPAAIWCDECSMERTLSDVVDRRCVVCGRIAPALVRGTELRLVSLEVHEDASQNRRGAQEHPA